MLASSIPYKFKTPWASSASAPNFITTPIPQTSVGAAAGQDLGFPPATAAPIASGGTPPNINDVNGAINYETLWSQWLQAGGPIGYDATFSTNIGGYPAGAIIRSATFGMFWLSTVDNNTTDPDTGGSGWVSGYPGRLLNIQTFTANTTYAETPGTNKVRVTAIGGGGAGGGAQATSSATVSVASGGAAGSYGVGFFSSGFSGATVTIGAGGIGAAGAVGGNGGSTSFGSLLTAPGGGGGGIAATNLSGVIVADQGAPGVPASGGSIINAAGNPGLCGFIITEEIVSGQGAGSPLGGGGTNTAGGLGGGATGFGAGGGGSANQVSVGGGTSGADGTQGVVIVEEFS